MYNIFYVYNALRPPLQKSTISKKISKSSFYYSKMQQNFLFQNIYNFLKKDQVLTDFWSQHWAYSPPLIFSEKSDMLDYESAVSKNLNLILLLWELPFILDYFLLVFVILSQQSVISTCSFEQKENMSLEWEIFTKKSTIY